MPDYITCSPVDPLQWMGAVRMSVQIADKKHNNNPLIIHMTPDKFIIKAFDLFIFLS